MTERYEPIGAGVLAGLVARVLRGWQEQEARRVDELRRCDCCDELMGPSLPDPHWQALTRAARAWQAEVERTRGKGQLFWPIWSPRGEVVDDPHNE